MTATEWIHQLSNYASLHMSRIYRRNRFPIKPLVENISERLQAADNRFRRSIVKYALVTFTFFVVYAFLAGPYGLFRINRLENREAQLTQENQRLLVGLIDADVTRQGLINDRRYWEYIARTRYLMARPGETIIRLSRRSGQE